MGARERGTPPKPVGHLPLVPEPDATQRVSPVTPAPASPAPVTPAAVPAAALGRTSQPATVPPERRVRGAEPRDVAAEEETQVDAIAPQKPIQPRRSVTRRPLSSSSTSSEERGLGFAILTTLAATVAPGSGHLILGRRGTGAAILGLFLLMVAGIAAVGLTADRAALLENALSTQVLVNVAIGCVLVAAAWVAVIISTYLAARPRSGGTGRQAVGVLVVTALCMVIVAPLGYGANLANSQRNLLNELFPTSSGGTAVAEAIAKPRLNVLLVGSDAGPDRTGARTDSMMVASIDTVTGRSTLFGLPRNIGFAQFPPGTPMAEEFPDGFHSRADPESGDYLLNAVYAYGQSYPHLAPAGPSSDPGLNLLHQTVSYMLGLALDYYVEVNMAGFESIIDALGGLSVDVGPEPIPVGGITPSGREVKPDRYIPPGVQQLSGADSLAFARSRTGTTDYARMGRQRCLLQNILAQKSPTDLLSNFQAIAAATTDSVSTNIPKDVLPALVSLAGDDGSLSLESVSFDPNLPDPSEDDGRFNTGRPNFPYMREVVQDAISRSQAPSPPAPTATAPTEDSAATDEEEGEPTEAPASPSAAPTSLATACG